MYMPMSMFKAESRKQKAPPHSENQFRQLLHALGFHPGLGTNKAQGSDDSLVCQLGYRCSD
jgi:hypothetical protein